MKFHFTTLRSTPLCSGISVVGSVVIEVSSYLCCGICYAVGNSLKFRSNLNDLEKEMKLVTDLRYKLEIESGLTSTQVSEWLKECCSM